MVDVTDDEFARGGETGRRVGEVETDEGGLGVGGEFKIVLEELGAGVEDEIDAGVELGIANGLGVSEVVGPLGRVRATKDVGSGGGELFLSGENGTGTGKGDFDGGGGGQGGRGEIRPAEAEAEETLRCAMDEANLGGGGVAVFFEVSRRRVSRRDGGLEGKKEKERAGH